MFWSQKKNDSAFDQALRDLLLKEPVPVAWEADVVVNRGPVDEPLLVHAYATCELSNGREYTDQAMEDAAIRFVSQQVDVDPADCQVISLTWSSKTHA